MPLVMILPILFQFEFSWNFERMGTYLIIVFEELFMKLIIMGYNVYTVSNYSAYTFSVWILMEFQWNWNVLM